MTVTVHHGDSRSGRALDFSVRPPMARLAQGHQIAEVVGGPVVVKQAERHDVMNVDARRPAMLTRRAVAGLRLSLLRHPVRAAMVNRTPFELRVQFADARPVAALAGAVEAAPCRYLAGRTRQARSAADAGPACARDLPGRHRLVLAGRRAMLAPPMLGARGRHSKRLLTMSAGAHDGGSARRENDCG